jgi:hypothetical protein
MKGIKMKRLTIWDVLRDRAIVLADETNSTIITWDGGRLLNAFLQDYVGWVELTSDMVHGKFPSKVLPKVPESLAHAQTEALHWFEFLLDYDYNYISNHLR